VHECKPGEALGDNSTKPVRVNVEECKISHETQLNGKVPSNVGMVDINTSNHAQTGVVKRRSTEDSIVGAHIGANPVSSGVKWVRIHGLLPRLESNVGSPKP
jgi:hypothetical protein